MQPPVDMNFVLRLRYVFRVACRLAAVLCVAVLLLWFGMHTEEAWDRATERTNSTGQFVGGQLVGLTGASRDAYWRKAFVRAWTDGWITGFYLLIGAIALWLLQNRLPRVILPLPTGNICPTCAYDLGASPPVRCPECGGETGAEAPPSFARNEADRPLERA